MNENEQIGEIAVILSDGGCKKCDCDYNGRFNCPLIYDAELLYKAGYRKVERGEWIEQVKVQKDGKPLLHHYQCSLCGVYLATETNFCPHCGADMRGSDMK